MGYTPKFQAIRDEIERKVAAKRPLLEIQEYFKTAVTELGQYERLNNLYKIRPRRPVPGEKSRLTFFCMNKMQEEFYKKHTNRDLILKMRQGGVTTLSCLIALDLCLWSNGAHAAIMAHVRDNVRQFFKISKLAFRCFQKDWGTLYPVTEVTDNINELGIKETGSSLKICTEAKGLTLDFLHISEAAFVENERISESLEAVPMSGWVIMETTPDTASGLFYDLWDQGQKGQTCSFKGHFFPWWYHYPESADYSVLVKAPDFLVTDKERVLKKQFELTDEHIIWRRLKISECGGDEGEFCRKYPEDPLTCFLSGSRSVFPANVLMNLWRHEKAPAFIGDLIVQ